MNATTEAPAQATVLRPKERQLGPDFIKGVAIVLMVYGHTAPLGTWKEYEGVITDWIYTFHMPLFLVVSGFFWGRLSGSLRKLFSQLIRPYLIFETLYLTALIVAQQLGTSISNTPPHGVWDLINKLLFHPIGGYWFLHTLAVIQFVGLSAVALCTRQTRSPKTQLLGLIAAFIILVCLSCADWISLRDSSVVYFFVGVALYHFDKKLPDGLVVGSLGALILALGWPDLIKDSLYVQCAWVICLLLLMNAWATRTSHSLLTKHFAWIGRNSLSILVFHAFFLVTCRPIEQFLLRFAPDGFTLNVATALFTVYACILASFLITKIRLSNLLFGSPNIYSPST